MRTRAASTALSLLATACLLAACGGGGDDSASADDGDDIATLGTSADRESPATDPDGSTPDASTPAGSAPDGSDLATEDTASEDPDEAMQQFNDCMRDHGVDLPDPPAPGAEAQAVVVTIDPGDEDNMQEAQEACGHLMENVRNDIELDPEEQAELEAEMLEFTECMRDHGIEMADPVFDDGGGVMIDMSSGEGAPEDQSGGPPIRDVEEFQAAAEECGGPGSGGAIAVNSEDG